MKEYTIHVPLILKVRDFDESNARRRADAFGGMALQGLRDQIGRNTDLGGVSLGQSVFVGEPLDVTYCDGDKCGRVLPAAEVRTVTWAKPGIGAGTQDFCPDCIARMVRGGYKMEIAPYPPPEPLPVLVEEPPARKGRSSPRSR